MQLVCGVGLFWVALIRMEAKACPALRTLQRRLETVLVNTQHCATMHDSIEGSLIVVIWPLSGRSSVMIQMTMIRHHRWLAMTILMMNASKLHK